MSQDTHTLLLFFDDEVLHKRCLLMFINLQRGDMDKAKQFSDPLGVTSVVTESWNKDWFNCELDASPDYISFSYDSRASRSNTYPFLQLLFKAGLSAAALNIFFDQVGEEETSFFIDGYRVPAGDYYRHSAKVKKVTEKLWDDISDSEINDEKTAIEQLIAAENLHYEDVGELLNLLKGAAMTSAKEQVSIEDMVESADVFRAIGKGVLQAILFGLFTILAFKGFWLWLTLSLILLVLLPYYHLSVLGYQVQRAVDAENGEELAC